VLRHCESCGNGFDAPDRRYLYCERCPAHERAPSARSVAGIREGGARPQPKVVAARLEQLGEIKARLEEHNVVAGSALLGRRLRAVGEALKA
jgi:hypothetical protein